MAASLYALGLNHQTAPLAIRERVVFHVERLRDALGEIKRDLAPEAAILSTCNRTELYVAGDEPAALAQWLPRFHPFRPPRPRPSPLPPPRGEAGRHLFSLAPRLATHGGRVAPFLRARNEAAPAAGRPRQPRH